MIHLQRLGRGLLFLMIVGSIITGGVYLAENGYKQEVAGTGLIGIVLMLAYSIGMIGTEYE